MEGVHSSTTGYAGGSGPAPTYWDLHRSSVLHRRSKSGRGWVEAVQLEYDPEVIRYRDLVDLMFKTQDPTSPNRDGANVGPEYHSTIYYHSDDQKRVATEAIREWSDMLGRAVVTSVVNFASFYPAEPEHQDFYGSNPTHPYCQYVIVPKLNKVLHSDAGDDDAR